MIKTLSAAVLIFAGFAGVAEAVDVRIRSKADVSGSYISLGDIAEVSGTDAKTRERLMRIRIGPTPPPGRAARFAYASIRKRMQSAGVDLSRIVFRGHSVVSVNAAEARPPIGQPARFQPVSFSTANSVRRKQAEKLLGNAVRQYLRRQNPDLGRVNVKLVLNADDVNGVASALRKEFDIRGGSRPWLDRRQTLAVRFYDARRTLQTISVGCYITRSPYVLVVRYRIPRGETIQTADLEWRQVDSIDGAFTELTQVVGKEAKRTIPKDRVLRKSDLKRVPLVRANDTVQVISRRGGITVTRYMKAKKEGAYDEVVPFQEIKGRGVVLAKVTGQGRAEIVTREPARFRSRRNERGSIQFRKAPPRRTTTSEIFARNKSAIRPPQFIPSRDNVRRVRRRTSPSPKVIEPNWKPLNGDRRMRVSRAKGQELRAKN